MKRSQSSSSLRLCARAAACFPFLAALACGSSAGSEGTGSQTAESISTRATRLPKGSNTQLLLPRNVLFADVDGDSNSEMIQFAGNKLFVKRTDFEQTGLAHLYTGRPIVKVLTGDFVDAGKDAVCPILDDGSLSCYGLSPDTKDLWWGFTQGSFVGTNEDAIVGDFDGNSRDEVLVYPRAGGPFRMYSVTGDAVFIPSPNYTQGNLQSVAVPGMQIRAGDFDGNGRTDIMAINSAGQISFFGSAFDGFWNTFWWGFTSAAVVGANESVTTGRVDDNVTDDIVLYDRSAGRARFLLMDFGNGYPPAVPGVDAGQIANWTNGELAMARQVGKRDTAIVYETNGGWMSVAGPAAQSGGLTYWWAYEQVLPQNDVGWPATASKPFLVLKCKYSDQTSENYADQWYHDMFGDVVGYFWEMSYGAIEIAPNIVDTWYVQSQSYADAQNLVNSGDISARWKLANWCLSASGLSKSGYTGAVVSVNNLVGSGAAGDFVLMDSYPHIGHTTWLAHEMSHVLGLADSADDSPRIAGGGPGIYFDTQDIMSAMNVSYYWDNLGVLNGPDANAVNKRQLGIVPEQRKHIMVEDPNRWLTGSVQLAAINRPEASGALFSELRMANGSTYTVEYRINDRLDAGLARPKVLVHRIASDGRPILVSAGSATGWDPDRLPGAQYLVDGKFYLTVNSFAPAGYTASITLTY